MQTPVSEQRVVTATASLAVNQCRKRLFPFFWDKHIHSENGIALPDCNFPKVVSQGYIFFSQRDRRQLIFLPFFVGGMEREQ